MINKYHILLVFFQSINELTSGTYTISNDSTSVSIHNNFIRRMARPVKENTTPNGIEEHINSSLYTNNMTTLASYAYSLKYISINQYINDIIISKLYNNSNYVHNESASLAMIENTTSTNVKTSRRTKNDDKYTAKEQDSTKILGDTTNSYKNISLTPAMISKTITNFVNTTNNIKNSKLSTAEVQDTIKMLAAKTNYIREINVTHAVNGNITETKAGATKTTKDYESTAYKPDMTQILFSNGNLSRDNSVTTTVTGNFTTILADEKLNNITRKISAHIDAVTSKMLAVNRFTQAMIKVSSKYLDDDIEEIIINYINWYRKAGKIPSEAEIKAMKLEAKEKMPATENYNEPYWHEGDWVFRRTTTPKTKHRGPTGKVTNNPTIGKYRDCDFVCNNLFMHTGIICAVRYEFKDKKTRTMQYKEFNSICLMEIENCKSEKSRPSYLLARRGKCMELTTLKVYPNDVNKIMSRQRTWAPFRTLPRNWTLKQYANEYN